MQNLTNQDSTVKKDDDKTKNFIGEFDPIMDKKARDKIIGARTRMLFKHPFFGSLAARLTLKNSDEWCGTAATDGYNFYYNSRFIDALDQKEVEFLVGHELLHCVYDHIGRRDNRDPMIWNIATDYAVNGDLVKHKIGRKITTVDCLYDEKYNGKISEEIYDDLMKNVKHISLEELADMILDEHLQNEGNNPQDGDGNVQSKKPALSEGQIDDLRRDMRQAIIAAAQNSSAGDVPAGIARIIDEIENPKMPWRELIQTTLTSAYKTDYSWMRPSRRSWHIDSILPGMTPGEEIEIAIAIDTSGSISNEQIKIFLTEINGIMESFDSYKIHVFSFDTMVYNPEDYVKYDDKDIGEYSPKGGGGTSFECIFNYLKERGEDVKRLIVFTDGFPFGSWGDPTFTETVWIIHGNVNPNPPFGLWAIYDE